MDSESLAAAADRERLETCERTIGYRFHDRVLLRRALTHSSVQDAPATNNERLEYLGDSVLGLVVAEYLFKTHRTFD